MNRLDADKYSCPILSVVDGDTISIQPTPELIEWAGFSLPSKQKIRLFGVDAPEMKQGEHGRLTREHTATALSSFSSCVLVPHDVDIYHRIVAEVLLDDLNLGLDLLRAGRAIAYRTYLGPKSDRRSRYLEAEDLAKVEGLGIWGDPEFVPPTVWRKRQKVAGII